VTPKGRFLLAHVIGWLAFLAWGVWSLYNWIYVEDGPAYFTDDPRRILWVGVISLIGGAIVFLFMKLPLATRRSLEIGLFGAMAFVAGGVSVIKFWSLYSLNWQDVENQWLLYAQVVQEGIWLLVCGVSILLVRHFRKAS
jgi:hypothetical protein